MAQFMLAQATDPKILKTPIPRNADYVGAAVKNEAG